MPDQEPPKKGGVGALNLKYLEASFEGFRRSTHSLMTISGGAVVALLGLFPVLLPSGVGAATVAAEMIRPVGWFLAAVIIYFNEAYQSFVMVQYKAMEIGSNQAEFRWQAGDRFAQEIERMDALLAELNKIQSGSDPDGYRFSENPFFLKFCPRVIFNLDDKGLFKGIYLPLDLWKRSNAAGRLKGSKGGSVLTFQNVGRRINNSEFVDLVSGSWVGTSIEQSAILGQLLRDVLASGKTVTFAIKHVAPEKDRGMETEE